MRAVVLALDRIDLPQLGLSGSRARLPVVGSSLGQALIATLTQQGWRDVVVVARSASELQQEFSHQAADGADVTVIEAGGSRTVGDWIGLLERAAGGLEETTLFCDSRVWAEPDLNRLLDAHRAARAAGTAAVLPGRQSSLEVLRWNRNGLLVADGRSADLTGGSAGCWLLEPGAVEILRGSAAESISAALTSTSAAERAAFRVFDEAFSLCPLRNLGDYWLFVQAALEGRTPLAPAWPEIQPGVYAQSPDAVEIGRASLRGRLWIGSGSRIGDGVEVDGPAWIGARCTVGGDSRLRRCVLADGTQAPAGANLSDCWVTGDQVVSPRGVVRELRQTVATGPHGRGRANGSVELGEDLLRLASRVADRSSTFVR